MGLAAVEEVTEPTFWFHDVMDSKEYKALLDLKPLFDKVAVIRKKDSETYGDTSIVKADVAKENKTTEGVIVSYGDACTYVGKGPAGHGTVCVFGVFAGVELPELGEQALILREEEILAFHKIGSERPRLAPPLPPPPAA